MRASRGNLKRCTTVYWLCVLSFSIMALQLLSNSSNTSCFTSLPLTFANFFSISIALSILPLMIYHLSNGILTVNFVHVYVWLYERGKAITVHFPEQSTGRQKRQSLGMQLRRLRFSNLQSNMRSTAGDRRRRRSKSQRTCLPPESCTLGLRIRSLRTRLSYTNCEYFPSLRNFSYYSAQ